MTWGVFPGQEIAQSTIIEKESFLAWKVCFTSLLTCRPTEMCQHQDEAFGIWGEWASYYAPGSEDRKLLDSVREQRWLVTMVHHDFKGCDALWSFLFNEGDPLVQ